MRRGTMIALIGAGYLALACFLTWPLGAGIATHLPQIGHLTGDVYVAGWALAWQTHALVSQPMEFANANIYGGVRHALFYCTPGFGLLPVYAPLYLATGNPTLALNATFLGELALTAALLHMVVRSWTRSHLAGVAAGTTFLTSSAALVICGAMPQYAALAMLPIIVWMVARPQLGWGAVLGLAALVAFQGLTDVVYLVFSIVLTLGLTGAVMCLRAPMRTTGIRILGALVLALLALSPIYAQYLAVRAANPDMATQSLWQGSPFRPWPDPTTGLPVFGWLAFDLIALIPAVAGSLAALFGMAPVPAARGRAWVHAGVWFVVGEMIAWSLPLQYPSLRVPLFGVVRDLARLGIGAAIALCLLTGLGFAACVEAVAGRVPSWLHRAVGPLLIALVVILRIGHAPFVPGRYPTGPAPVPGPEAAILRASNGPVLVLPVGDPRIDGRSHAVAMYGSTAHWRTLVNGYCSYYPRGFRERIDLARQLPNRSVLTRLQRDTGLTTIVVYAGSFPRLTTGPWRTAIASGALPGVRVQHDDGEVMVLAVDARGVSGPSVAGTTHSGS